jgi:hypothetical protein
MTEETKGGSQRACCLRPRCIGAVGPRIREPNLHLRLRPQSLRTGATGCSESSVRHYRYSFMFCGSIPLCGYIGLYWWTVNTTQYYRYSQRNNPKERKCVIFWLRCFRAFSSVVRQMPGYNSQRRGTARTLPISWIVLLIEWGSIPLCE